MTWAVIVLREVEEWLLDLAVTDPETADQIVSVIDRLEEDGPALGRPLVGKIEGSKIRNLKELRPGSAGATEVRILFAFDPARQAVLLVAGDKAGAWKAWYREAIKQAEERFTRWLAEED